MDVHTSWVPKTEAEKDQVRRQMERLLETAHFKNSRRYPALLRFIVEETLEGRGEFLKERLLGVRVFNRPPDYDTADDPIARVTIAEIRKRIALYYHEEAHESEMRIELLPGRYEPGFDPRRARTAPAADRNRANEEVAPKAAPDADAAPVQASKAGKTHSRYFRWGLSAAVVLSVTVASALTWRFAQPSALNQLWSPILSPHREITFCLPSGAAGPNIAASEGILSYSQATKSNGRAPVTTNADAARTSFLEHEKNGENVVFSDLLATVKISDFLAAHHGEQRVRLDDSTTLDDLQQGPTVLIGGLDNEWTLRAVAHLRYRFLGTDQETYWITDTKNPGKKIWEVDLKKQYPAVKRDYALVARFHNDSTMQVQVIVAGIGMSGTAAAGEFMVDPAQLEELRKRVGPGFRDRDFEAVLGTDVVNGIPGAAKILAVEVW